MSNVWPTIALVALTTAALRVCGPILIGRRELPAWAIPVIEVLPGAMLTALIVVQTFSQGDRVVVDERALGIAVAGAILIWRRNALIPAVLAAVIVVALLRAIT
jgi:uncharacterized membrane protein